MTEEWTDERIELLASLWKEGLPTGEIGRRLGVTKNAVVGKVHRLGLPKRPSPIKRGAAAKVAKKPKKVEKKKPEVVTLVTLKSGMCAWPIGDPGSPDFHFCGKPATPGKPYCEDHCNIAYVRGSKEAREAVIAKAVEESEPLVDDDDDDLDVVEDDNEVDIDLDNEAGDDKSAA